MSRICPVHYRLSMVARLILAGLVPAALGSTVLSATVQAAENDETDPFAFFLDEPLPRATLEALEYKGYAEASFINIGSDNQQFSRYNGLYDKGLFFSLDLDYLNRDAADPADYFGLYGQDLGLKTSSAGVYWGRSNDYRLELGYSRLYQNNGLAYSPFQRLGTNSLTLPGGWVAASTADAMTGLNDADNLRLERQRDRFLFRFRKRFDEMWSFSTAFHNEEKSGLQTLGAAHYLDASNPHAVLLPQSLDYSTHQLDLIAHMRAERGNLELRYVYSSFENKADGLVWQNPYSTNYGPAVDYPNGYGQMSLMPDNQMHQWRALGNYRISDTLLAQADLSYSLALQNDDFLPYTVNSALSVPVDLPRDSLDGKVGTTTLNASLRQLVNSRLTVVAKYRYEDRDNRSPRDGYQYVRGDSGDQPGSEFSIYNRPVSHTKNTLGVESQYRFASRTRLDLGYEYEEITRYNAAVETTQEDHFSAGLSNGSVAGLGARLSVDYYDRGSDTYQWDQSYYALLDPQLINATPDSQRYNNHPLLSQYYLANRQRLQTRLNLSLGGGGQWQHNLDIVWRDDDYDQSELGLLWQQDTHLTLSSTWLPLDELSVTAYYALGYMEAEQRGRSFRGGQEKNAFVVIPPYPQASDPERNWTASPTDISNALGINSQWQVIRDVLDVTLDYQFTQTRGEQNLWAGANSDVPGADLPDNRSREHHLTLSGNYQLNQQLRLGLNYQYYRFNEDNWAVDGVQVDSIDKVLWSGSDTANETVNAVAVTVTYNLP